MDNAIANNIQERISQVLEKTGMYYRIFSREKTKESIIKKLTTKKEEYSPTGKKMQDFVGVRVVFYFKDDVDIFLNILRGWEGYDPKNESNSLEDLVQLDCELQSSGNKDWEKMLPLTDKVFMPERLNLVMRMNSPETDMLNMKLSTVDGYDTRLIDNTYEIQLRTVLSEGWHEVEHDLRYKTRKEPWWNSCQEESRLLNGIYAALMSNESQLSRIVDDIAYKAYHSQSWDTMLRFHFRRRTESQKLSCEICDVLNRKHDTLAKSLYRCEREQLVVLLSQIEFKIQITTDLIAFIANRLTLNDSDLLSIEPKPTKLLLDKVFKNN